MVEITQWLPPHFFGVTSPLVFGRYSGETLFFWIQTSWILGAAILGTITWSVLDRQRENYIGLHKWFRLFVRLALAASMFEYGMTKVIPVQFARPTLNTLVTPAGNLSLSNILWTSIGAAPLYEIFTGCAEMLGGILLLAPQTTTLGALLCLAGYDPGLCAQHDLRHRRQTDFSLHLIALALFLLAPEFRRLADFFVFPDRQVRPSAHLELFATARWNRVALIAQLFVRSLPDRDANRRELDILACRRRSQPKITVIWYLERPAACDRRRDPAGVPGRLRPSMAKADIRHSR